MRLGLGFSAAASAFGAAGFFARPARLGFGFSSAFGFSVASASGSTAVSCVVRGRLAAPSVSAGASRIVTWHVFFWIRATRPRARARQRLITGPSST